MVKPTIQQIDSYLTGKKWYWYLPLWVFGTYVFFVLIGFDPNQPTPWVVAIPQSFDFMLHEMAHIVTAFLPSVICAASGSLSEIGLGLLLIYLTLRDKRYFILIISCLWFMLACQSAGVYMADARAQKLVLVSLGAALSGSSEVRHDWNYVFGQLHLLPYDKLIGDSVRVIGGLVGLASLVFGAWLMYRAASLNETSKTRGA